MTELAPFRLDPVLVERPWGGTRLTDYGKTLPAGVNIGEAWELCDLPQEVVPHVDDPSSGTMPGVPMTLPTSSMVVPSLTSM